MSTDNCLYFYLTDVLEVLPCPSCGEQDRVIGFQGACRYCHYGEQGTDDRGWGCGYRTLQTLVEWNRRKGKDLPSVETLPTLFDIQRALVEMQDKPADFEGSREWIGTFEASICVDYFAKTLCKLHHVAKGCFSSGEMEILKNHFSTCGCPVMMGGLTDSSSKCLLAVTDTDLLIMDPHYYGPTASLEKLCAENWIRWTPISKLEETSYYNLCLLLKH